MRHTVLFVCVALACAAAQQPSAPAAPASKVDWTLVEKTLGRPGAVQDGVHKVTFWRTDMPVMIGRTHVAPAAALGSWIAFRETPSGITCDGDLVLARDEVAPVMDALQQHGFEITALHNHLMFETPEVMYMHFFARGDLGPIVDGMKAALERTHTPTTAATTKPPQGSITYDQKTIEQVIGKAGTASGPVLAFGFPRSQPIMMHAVTMPPPMGMATAINFQPSPHGVAATGDFVLLENEVNPVLAALRKGGITVTAVHNHMLDDNPRMVFVHFWAEGPAERVARTLRDALDQTK